MEEKKEPTCNKCGAKIKFVKSDRQKWQACNPDLVDLADLEIGHVLFTEEGSYWKRKEKVYNVVGYQSHWNTCTAATSSDEQK